MAKTIRLFVRMLILSLLFVTMAITTSSAAYFNGPIIVTHAQTIPLSCYNGVVMPTSPATHVPVILIHGYYEGSEVWSKWMPLLRDDRIPFCTVTFSQSSDPCGKAIDHANELTQIVQKVKDLTGAKHVNIVGHSKGGLDARVYLAQSGTHDVANLVMIGTPNAGSPLADSAVKNLRVLEILYSGNPYWKPFADYWACKPALLDLETNAADINAAQNNNTRYHTIAGDWTPLLVPTCTDPNTGWPWPAQAVAFLGWETLLNHGSASDGIVPIWSVESKNQPYFDNLSRIHKHPTDCHQDLLGYDEYRQAAPILLGRQ